MTKVVNKYKDEYDIYIGRGSLFGNPYSYKSGTLAIFKVKSREESIEKYKDYFYKRINSDLNFKNSVLQLKNKTLGCFCKPKACHGDIIVEYLMKNNI